MIRPVGRSARARSLRLLAAVTLLLAGLLQTAASAHAASCPRLAGSAHPGVAADAGAVVATPAPASLAAAAAAFDQPGHRHAADPAADGAEIPSSSCPAPALPAARAIAPAASPHRHLSPTVEPAAGHTVPRSHFRPPRPS